MQSVRKDRAVLSSFLLLALIGWMIAATGLAQVNGDLLRYGHRSDRRGSPRGVGDHDQRRDWRNSYQDIGCVRPVVFDFVHIGSYTLRVEAQGFKKYQITGLQFAAAQNVRRTFSLELERWRILSRWRRAPLW